MRDEHMIVTCRKCGIEYDMDFEPAIDDQHGECYSELWDVEVISCDEYGVCDCEDSVAIPWSLRGIDVSDLILP